MEYSEVTTIVNELLTLQKDVAYFQDKKPILLKAVGWQLALRYKNTRDKESQEAKEILAKLVEIRTLVRSKLKMEDALMYRFKQANN